MVLKMRAVIIRTASICFLFLQCIHGNTSFLNQVANYINLISAYNYGNEYDTVDVIPLEDVSRVMEVNVAFSLFAINGFDEVAGKMDLVAAINLTWIDESPLITSSVFTIKDRESFLVPYDKIWTPKLVLENAVGETTEVGDQSYLCSFNMKTYRVTWKPRVMVSGACTPDVTYYPFDKQECSFTYTGWGFRADEMSLIAISNEWDMTDYEQNGEWNILETSTETSIRNEQSFITFSIKIARKPMYFAFNIVMPVLILCCLNSVVFLLPAESGERVGFSVTCFLSFMVILNMVMDIMPRSSSPISYLCFYLVVMMCNSGAMTLVTVLLMRVYFKPEKEQVPKWISRLVTFINCGCARIKCCILLCRCLKQSCSRCKNYRRMCNACYKSVIRSKVSKQYPDETESNARTPIINKKWGLLSFIRCQKLSGDTQKVKSKPYETDQTEDCNENTIPLSMERTVKKSHLSISRELSVTRKNKSNSSETKLPSTVFGHGTNKSEYQEIAIPELNYPESPRLKFRKFLKGDILLQPIFNDEPFRKYFKPVLSKRKRVEQAPDDCLCLPFWNIKHSSCFNAKEVNNLEFNKPVEIGISYTPSNKLAENIVKDISFINVQKNVQSPNDGSTANTSIDKCSNKDRNLSQNIKIINTHPHTQHKNIAETRTRYSDTDSIGNSTFFTDSSDEEGSLTDLEVDVHWSEVGRVLDIFFFLAFLGAQIFLTIVFFVPIATN